MRSSRGSTEGSTPSVVSGSISLLVSAENRTSISSPGSRNRAVAYFWAAAFWETSLLFKALFPAEPFLSSVAATRRRRPLLGWGCDVSQTITSIGFISWPPYHDPPRAAPSGIFEFICTSFSQFSPPEFMVKLHIMSQISRNVVWFHVCVCVCGCASTLCLMAFLQSCC